MISIDLIGGTPLVRLKKIEELLGLKAHLLAKLEWYNIGGSVKSRVAVEMLDAAEKEGRIGKNSVIIEPTSGNTGIGLAAVGVSRGYRVIIVMPESMSLERRKIIKAYGAELVLTDAKLGMQGAIDKADELALQIPNSIVAGQFSNPANPAAHFKTTGPEIYEDTDGSVDIFVAGIGTGGTVSGVGKYLKSKNGTIQIVGVEPAGSPVITQGVSGTHKIQGIGAGFIPQNLDMSVVDSVIAIGDDDAILTSRLAGNTEGLLIGISSGAALCAAISLAQLKENAGKNIVVLFPDSGERYLSTNLYE